MAQDVLEQNLLEVNNQALEDYERLVERIAVLGQSLGNARNLSTIFRALRDFAVVSVPCDGLVISLYDPEKETPGRGTTFKVYLPRVDEVAQEQELDGGLQTLATGSETVLLVEDEHLVRDLTMEMLKECGYGVITGSNGEEALRVSREFEGRIDLMITDVVMPRMGGRALAEHLAVLRPETKVLYMSGYTDDAIVRHGILDEQVSFIQKPFSADVLLMKARQVLDQPVNEFGDGDMTPAAVERKVVTNDIAS
ncbi:MAG: response regulator [Acidobacteriota bacterium]|nr:response regulator [Acidobacteriota bacterium]